MKMRLQRVLAAFLSVVMLIGLLPINAFGLNSAEIEPVYKVEIVSYIRGEVKNLRCSELLEARIYKSVDNEATWVAVTDVEGVPVSKLTYTWSNTSANTPMVVYLSHNMAEVGLYGDTKEGTFKNGVSSTAVGAQWAAYKTPGYDVGNGMGGFWGPSWGSGSSSSTSKEFSGTATVQVSLPDGTVIQDSCSDFEGPNLEADLNNIALGLFIGESTTFLDLLAESGIVHINCSMCSVSNIQISDNDGVISYVDGVVSGLKRGEGSLSLTVSKRNCTVHNGQTASVSTKIFVFKKPTTSTTTTTLTLARESIDEGCRYFINGVEGTKQDDGTILFSGLDPDTKYTVDVVATYGIKDGENTIVRYAYSYVSDTTKPLHIATVNTYLNSLHMDIEDIHGENITLYIKAENGEYIPLTHSNTGVYTASVDNGIYHVYHLEEGNYHRINDNPLIISNAPASVNVHHYSVSYDAAGGSFKNNEGPTIVNYASGQEVIATSAAPEKDSYVFAGWKYGEKTYFSGDVVTSGISEPITLVAQWERKIDVFVNVTIDHTYTDDSNNIQTDSNIGAKDDVNISLVARDSSTSAYLEVKDCNLTLKENSHSGHTLYADGVQVESYTGINAEAVKKTQYEDGQSATFIGLSGGKDYFVTVDKASYDATVTAKKAENGDWIIDVSLKFNPTSQDLEFEVNMEPSVPAALYPKAAIVKILYFDEISATWKIITQHNNGNPGVRVEIEKQAGNKGSYPVWTFDPESEKPYGYRIKVSAFVYADGTIVPTEEISPNTVYSDKNYTAEIGDLSDGAQYGSLMGAYFDEDAQVGSLNAEISVESYSVTFNAMGGTINGNKTQTIQDQYYIPAFDAYQPTMDGHKFLGWWYQDENGNYTQKAKDGILLTEDITLYAMWDQTLNGSLTLAGTYMLDDKEVSIWESDRATEAIVVLQEIASDSVNTIDYQSVAINWNENTGHSEAYHFTGLNPLKQYRISVLLANYTTQYQNSSTSAGSYNAQDYRAVYQESDPWETFVNGKLIFEPESYYQPVSVDASQIGSDFRPNKVQTEIWYTERNTDNAYKPISQHTASGGIAVSLDADGNTNGTFGDYVWRQNFNGNLYDYTLKVTESGVLNKPISIVYGPSSNFETVGETAKNILTATLVPNEYAITYDLNIADNNDDVFIDYDAHTWSHETEITYVPTRTGYVFKGWQADERVFEDGKVKATVAEDVTLTAIWEEADCDYTIEYYFDNVLKNTEQKTAKYLNVIDIDFENSIVYESQNYALDQVIGQPLTIDTDVSKNIIKVYYAIDHLSDKDDDVNTPDGIPDKYQAVVTFNIINGTWNNADDAKSRVYTLYEKDASGEWNKLSNVAFGATPAGTANEGFENSGKWSPQIPDTVERSATYTLSFNKVLTYTVTIIVENGTGNIEGQSESFTSKHVTVAQGSNLSLEFNADDGFALDYIAINGNITTANGTQLKDWNAHPFENITKDQVIHVVYSTDVISDETDREESDDIPDKYQKKVIFKVVNGTWDGANAKDIIKYVTLKTNDQWDVNGSAAMPEIPENMQANEGFKKGTWNVDSFPATLSGTNTVTYTHTFKPIAYKDYTYKVEHYKQLANGAYVLEETEACTISSIELNADENDFEKAQSAVNAIAKDYGAHFSENTNHPDRKASGTPKFNEQLTLKLFYKLDSHTIKYDLNGGTATSGVDYSEKALLCGNSVTVQAAPHRTGYTFEGWLSDQGKTYAAGDALVLETNVTLTAQWKKQTGLSYLVRYFDEDTNQVIKTEKRVGNMTFEYVVNSSSEVIAIDDYLFAYANPETLTIGVNESSNVINLYYTLDTVGGGEDGEDSDDIPDKYQKKVIFKVVNGTWDGANAKDIIKYVTLKTNDQWDVNGSAAMPEIPENMKANEGFKKGTWNVDSFPATLSGTNAVTYTHTFKPIAYKDYTYKVEHYKQLANGAYVLEETEACTISSIELNADENDFEKAQSAVNAIAKDYGAHFSENTNHPDRKASGTPKFNEQLTLKLFYKLDSHTIKYDLNGGTATSGVDYSEKALLCGNSVTVEAAPHRTGYTFEGWLSDQGKTYAAGDALVLETNVTLTAQWKKQTGLFYLVRYFDEDTNQVIKAEKRVGNMTFEDVVNSSSEVIAIDDYHFSHADPETLTIGVNESSNVINLYYTLDTVGGGEDGEDSDDIPDKYQKKVIFKVVNGTWDGKNDEDIIKYITLMTNGEMDADGSATMPEIPENMQANVGFKKGAWNVDSFPTTITGTTDITYLFTFIAEKVETPKTGDNSNIHLWYMLLFASAASFFGLSLLNRKKAARKR